MKKILIPLSFVVLLPACKTLAPEGVYPGQSVEGRKPVPKLASYVVEMPLVKKIGGVYFIHDIHNDSWIRFKGDDTTMITKMQTWLDEYLDEGEVDNKTPVILIAGTNIAPLTLFTAGELDQMSEEDRVKAKEMAGYKTYNPTVFTPTYMEDISPIVAKEFNLEIGSPANTNPAASENKQQRVNTTKPRTTTGNPNRARRSG